MPGVPTALFPIPYPQMGAELVDKKNDAQCALLALPIEILQIVCSRDNTFAPVTPNKT